MIILILLFYRDFIQINNHQYRRIILFIFGKYIRERLYFNYLLHTIQ